MSEVWKPIEGYEGIYEVSSLGRVRSLERTLIDNKGRRHPVPSRILKPKNDRGYCKVFLCDLNKRKECFVHRLVAQAFLPNPNNYPVINHKDENPHNNHVDNIEWCTISYNTRYGTGMARHIEHTVFRVKAVEQLDLQGNHIAFFESISEAARATNCHKAVISKVCKGQAQTSGGYKWRFKE